MPGPPADAAALSARLETIAETGGDDATRRAQAIEVLNLYLAKHRAAAETRLLAGGAEAGVRVAWDLAAAADAVVVALWGFAWRHVLRNANPTQGERMALVAVGGYGRAVLAPFSDLDLLFLRPWKENATSESLTEFMLYALWDLGFKVGHASRTVTETIKLARADMTIRTAVLEARFLVGDEKLYGELRKRFVREVVRGTAKDFVAAKLDERDRRHAKSGASRYLVEPNVKDGKGGLRDLHTLYWIARYLDPTTERGDKALEDVLTAKDRRTVAQAFNFLWAVRIHMHFVAGRGEERLSFELQPEIARRMGWRGRADESAVERFMRRYFLIAKDVGALTRAFCAKLEQDRTKTARGLSRLLPSAKPKRRKLDDPAFVEEDGRLTIADPQVFERDPSALLRLFRTADAADLDLHPDAFTAVARSLHLVTPKFRRDPKTAEIFLDILARGSRPGRILQLMNDAGLLGRFLPEFARIVGQTQLNRHHAYTVDEHTLRAIGIIGDIDNGRLSEDHPLSTSIMPVIADKEALYLAMLMHDTGKGGTRGQEDDGSIAARRACDRLGLAHQKAELTAWLVRHHLVMSDYAQKRDVSDPDTVAAFARIVETPERLRLLLVLTTADIRAVGPGVWNDWKGQLLRELYAATEAALRGGRGADPATAFRKRAQAEAVVAREGLVRADPKAAAFAEALEDSYFTTTPFDEQKAHAELAREAETGGAAARARFHEDRGALELTVAAKDRRGLFADLTERLSSLGAQVVGARLFTSQRGLALDVFYLQDATGAPWGRNHPAELGRLKREIEAAAKEATPRPRREAEKPWRTSAAADLTPTVVVDNEATDAATIVEVSGRDRPGLLASLARRLAAADLSVQSAHIENYGLRAVDAFYVLTAAGEKLTEHMAIDALKAELAAVFAPAPSRATA
ncbi:MAG TPA: [protein-PII] uridylyltransferase [Caulobacteraceae bacterium]